MQNEMTKLHWADRMALIDAYQLSDAKACEVFSVQPEEIEAVRAIKSSLGAPTIDVMRFTAYFNATPQTAAVTEPAISKQKTGPKTNKIQTAFAAITEIPTPVDEFLKAHDVSLAVLRQHKRFDHTGIPGAVRIRKDKTTKAMMIVRELSE